MAQYEFDFHRLREERFPLYLAFLFLVTMDAPVENIPPEILDLLIREGYMVEKEDGEENDNWQQ
jgi:hypothetical protein